MRWTWHLFSFCLFFVCLQLICVYLLTSSVICALHLQINQSDKAIEILVLIARVKISVFLFTPVEIQKWDFKPHSTCRISSGKVRLIYTHDIRYILQHMYYLIGETRKISRSQTLIPLLRHTSIHKCVQGQTILGVTFTNLIRGKHFQPQP